MNILKYNLEKRTSSSIVLEVAYIRDEIKIRYIVENAGAGNLVRIEARLVGQSTWNLLLDIIGTDNQLVDVSTWEEVRVSVLTYDSLSNYIDIIGSSFDNVSIDTSGLVDSVNGQTGVVVIEAIDIPNTPAGNLTATDVQTALDELQSEIDTLATDADLQAHINELVAAHAASAISNTPLGNLSATDVQSALDELQSDIDAHLADPTDAHDASSISSIPLGNLSAVDVQAALDELQADIDTRATDTDLQDHITETVGAHAATAISNTPAGTISSIEVQAAINELDGDIQAHINDAVDAHAASAISNIPSGNLAAIEVQAALNELQTDIDTRTAGPASSVDGEVALFDGITGKLLKSATGTGFAKLTAGVLSTSATVDASTELSGITPVVNGGTGASTLTLNNLIVGDGTSPVTFIAPGADGTVLRSDGTVFSSQVLAADDVSNTPAGTIAATDVQTAINELDGDIQAHITETVGAHAASAISNAPTGNLAATDVQTALDELQADIDTRALDADLQSHITETVGAHDATAISFTPTGTISAIEVQAALAELDGDIQAHITDAVDAHDASAISNIPSGNLAAIEVQAALNELQSDIDTRALDTDLQDHITETVGAHAASAISSIPSGNLAATDVQSALDELQSDIDTRALDADVIKHDGSVDFTGDQSMGGFNLTNLADPVAAQDAATKAYVDAVAEGLKPKEAVRAGTLVNGALATDFEDGDVIDGVTLATGDRILIKDQTAAEENGIYIVEASGAPTRAPDFDSLTPIDEINGSYTFIQEGSQAGQGWVQTGVVTTIDVDPINFVFFNSVSGIIGGDGITVTGSTISVDHDGEGLTFVATQLSLELDGATLSKSATGLKLGDTAVTPGTYGSASETVTFTVDQQGRLTAASEQSISITASQVSDFNTAASAAAPVQSVNTQTGAVVLDSDDIAEGTNLYFTDERAQDAVGTILTDSNTIDFTYNDGTPSIVADVRTQMSITSDASGIKLVNDATTPGVTKYYGTDSGGIRGFFSFSAQGSAGDIPEMSFSLTNNQATPADVTGFLFPAGTVRSFSSLTSVEIDATADLYEQFTLQGINKAVTFNMSQDSVGDTSGVVFSITSTGQVQYTSANYAGFVSGFIKFRAITTTV